MDRNFKQQKTVQHKCPNCGAALTYDPTTGNLYCSHCDGHVDFEKSEDVKERDFSELVTHQVWKDSDVATFRCSNCGAVEVAPRTSLATKCPYCSAPIVIEDQTSSIVQPDTIIPFELSTKQAIEQLAAWRKRKLFAPNKFRKQIKEDCIRGVFVPAWTFDAQTSSNYDGTVGYHRTRTVRRNGKTYTETYTEWKHVSGVIDASFDDIVIRANDNIPENYFQKLQPYSQTKYKVYDDEYLAGYLADHYSLEPLDAFEKAKAQMEQNIRSRIVVAHHADVEGNMNVDMHINSKSFKYLMLPVYVAATKYNNKVYNQYISGVYNNDEKKQSKICGKAPISPLKVLLTVLICLGALIGCLFLAKNQGLLENSFDDWSSIGLFSLLNGKFM